MTNKISFFVIHRRNIQQVRGGVGVVTKTSTLHLQTILNLRQEHTLLLAWYQGE